MSMSSVRRLLGKTLSSKHQQSKPSGITINSPSFLDENAPPLDPNIQHQFPLSNPKKSPSRLAITQKATGSDQLNEASLTQDPSVKVVVRIKPKTVIEKLGDPTIKKVSEDTVAVGDRKFCFSSVIDSSSKQEDVFRLVGVPLVTDALAGYNASILSYGQTGSGKTYTMWGPPNAMVEGHSASSQQGIVPRIFQMLFSEIEKEKESPSAKQINYQCRCSFLEIYNGQIGDLLDPTQRNLQIKDGAENGFYIETLSEEYVNSYEDVTQILIKGLSSRKVGATSRNSKSSRSHVAFTCVIESWCKERTANSFSSSKTSRISFVDLAALDRNKQANAGREFERERKDVKSSLSHLGHLVNILSGRVQPDDFMYRDSCLTHLLQESLGGNAKLSVICTISPDINNYGETLRTLRFGHRIGSIQNKPVISEVTEEDMDDLTDQIRQLKEELIRAKLNVSPAMSENARRSLRESMNQLRISINRSLMLPHVVNDDIKGVVDIDENGVDEPCNQLDRFHKSSEGNAPDVSCESDNLNFASVRGSCDSYFTTEHEINCLHESLEISSSRLSTAFEEPALSDSPKIRNIQRKSIVSESSNFGQSEPICSSLRSSRVFSGPTESLAASLKKGLEIIDSHHQSSSLNKSVVAFSFDQLMLRPSPAADKVNASVQTSSLDGRPSLCGSSTFLMCLSCRQKGQNVSSGVEDSLKTWISTPKREDAKEAQENAKITDLEKVCTEQAAKIEELSQLVEQLKSEKGEKDIGVQNSQALEDKEPEIVKETCEIGDSQKQAKGFCDMREKEELLMEIQYLRNKLQAYAADLAPNKSIDKLRSSLLSHSIQLQKSMSSQFNTEEELVKEREKWTEMESEWINLTDELRIDIESQRQYVGKLEMELEKERKYIEELDDALHRAVLGHARFVEHYVDLQEKYDCLFESNQRIMETITDMKRAASKAEAKGSGARYAKAFVAELSTTRTQEKRERERLRKENNSLRIQLRETAVAVQTAGELLARLREAEGAASFAETTLNEVQRENEKLKKQMEKLKNKHKLEMVTMKQYMADSKLPELALRPSLHTEQPTIPTSTFPGPNDDEAWRAEFGGYKHHY